jgi:hypothetical protein
MTRIRAFLTHFGLSTLIVSLVLTIVLVFWYPPPFFQIIGATDALKILIGVDLVLGPLLTLVLFKPGKRGLMFDMTCVALLQVSALAYGVSVLHEERPYFAVFAKDRFEVLAHKDVVKSQLRDDLGEKPWRTPLFAIADLPEDKAAYEKAFEEILFEGKPDIQYQPKYWSRYDQQSNKVVAKAKPLTELLSANPDAADAINNIASGYASPDQLGYVPVIGKKQPFALVIDLESTLPIDIIAVDPYKKPQQLARSTDVHTVNP